MNQQDPGQMYPRQYPFTKDLRFDRTVHESPYKLDYYNTDSYPLELSKVNLLYRG